MAGWVVVSRESCVVSPRSWRIPVTLANIAIAGCVGSTDVRSASVRDSSGVTIVTNGEFSPQWNAERALTIGVTEGDPAYRLHGISDATRLPDGRLVVLSSGSNDLRFFGSDGTHLRARLALCRRAAVVMGTGIRGQRRQYVSLRSLRYEGAFCGARFRIPGRFEPLEIDENYMLGVSRNALDVERIELYPRLYLGSTSG